MPDSPPPYLAQGCITPYPRSEVLRRWLWALVQATVFRWSPRPCHAWRAWLLRWFGATIPDPGQVVVFPTVRVLHPWCLTLEPRSMLGRQVVVYNPARITLAYGANVSQYTHLCAGTHDYSRWAMPLVARPIVIGRNAWVAADVFVGPRGDRGGALCDRRTLRRREEPACPPGLRRPSLPTVKPQPEPV